MKKSKKPKVQEQKRGSISENEIIINMTPKAKAAKSGQGKQKKRQPKKSQGKKPSTSSAKKTGTKKVTTNIKKTVKIKRRRKILKWITIILLIIIAIVMFLMTSIFNIREIVVYGNSRISSLEIIEKSRTRSSEITCSEGACGMQRLELTWNRI